MNKTRLKKKILKELEPALEEILVTFKKEDATTMGTAMLKWSGEASAGSTDSIIKLGLGTIALDIIKKQSVKKDDKA